MSDHGVIPPVATPATSKPLPRMLAMLPNLLAVLDPNTSIPLLPLARFPISCAISKPPPRPATPTLPTFKSVLPAPFSATFNRPLAAPLVPTTPATSPPSTAAEPSRVPAFSPSNTSPARLEPIPALSNKASPATNKPLPQLNF